MLADTIAFQPNLVVHRPAVVGNKEFTDYCELLNRIDELLQRGDISCQFVRFHIDQVLEAKRRSQSNDKIELTPAELKRAVAYAIRALRCNIAGVLLGESFRGLSLRIAESSVLQEFCRVGDLVKVRVPGKSLLCEYRNQFPVEMIQEAIDSLCRKTTNSENCFELVDPLTTDEIYIDCTCLEGNIHFPVDWLLLRDAVRTIIKSILVIRGHGLHSRICAPKDFLRQVNIQCIAMSQCRRQKGAGKARKQILRRMKKISQVVEQHGHRYVSLLRERFEETELSEGEVAQIVKRLNTVLEQLPAAREQAHRRIIRGEQLANDEKILSFYDSDISVIKRGKTNAEVEFGNELFLAEQSDGLIVDWKLYRDQPPADSKKLPEVLDRLKSKQLSPNKLCADRGFFSAANGTLLEEHKITNFICPRAPTAITEAMKQEDFRLHQRRRGQTESRIGIVKNCFTGNPTSSRVFDYRERQVAWAILGHNLWVVARLPRAESEEDLEAA